MRLLSPVRGWVSRWRWVQRYRIARLLRAVERGNYNKVDRLLAAGADPNGARLDWLTEFPRQTPLTLALFYGNPSIVRRLLAVGADPNFKIYDCDGRFSTRPAHVSPLAVVLTRWELFKKPTATTGLYPLITPPCADSFERCAQDLVMAGADVGCATAKGVLGQNQMEQEASRLIRWQAERMQQRFEQDTASVDGRSRSGLRL